eukprot:g5162.t1
MVGSVGSRRPRRLPSVMLHALLDELLLAVLGFLDARSVCQVSAVANRLAAAAGSDVLWRPLLGRLWLGKVNRMPPSLVNGRRLHLAFRDSVIDSRRAQLHGAQELCSLVFAFRFKQEAGEFWHSRDPSSRGLPAMWRQFRPDGTIVSRGGAARKRHDFLLHDEEVLAYLPPIRWRFTKSQNGVRGQFVQVNRWPSYSITRGAHDWRWHLESCWVTYDSVDLADVLAEERALRSPSISVRDG